MGGKSEILNYENMAALHTTGTNCIAKIKNSAKSIEEKIALLKSDNFAGEKGIAYRQALTAVSGALNELLRTTEKATIFIDTKLNVSKKVESNTQTVNAESNKAKYLALKK